MELALNRCALLFTQFSAGNGDVDGVLLPQVAHISRAGKGDVFWPHTFISKKLAHFLLEFAPGGTKLGHLHVRGMHQFGLHQVVSQVAHQHAPGGEVSRSERNNDTWHMHISCQRACMHGATSTKSHHGELARITSLPYRDQFEKVYHIGIGDAYDAQRRIFNAHPQRSRDGRYRLTRALHVEANAAAQEILGVDAPDDNVGIGHRGLGAATPIGGWTRFGARAAWPDFERSCWIDPGDAPTSGPDFDDIDDRHFDRIARRRWRALDEVIAGKSDGAVLYQGDFGGCSADVQRDQILLAEELADHRCSNDSTNRPRFDQVDGRAARCLKARDPAIGSHGVACLPAYAHLVESRGESVKITSRDGLDIGIQHDGAGTLEFAPFVGQFM